MDELVSRQYYVTFMTNKHNAVLYTGMTNDLRRRTYEHRTGRGGGFTSRYNVVKLVYYGFVRKQVRTWCGLFSDKAWELFLDNSYEVTGDVNAAIAREKQIKAGSRQKKIDLVEGMNPGWVDLYEEL